MRTNLLSKFRIIFFALLISCGSFAQTTEVVFLQMNDVYEIAPLEGGKFGGLARVSTLRQKLLKENPNTFTELSGDFISPSALSTSSYDGEKINGKQMVDVLNFIGVDLVTFGNHEFDYKPEILQQRMNESRFEWIVSNVKTNRGEALWKFGKTNGNDFEALPEYKIQRVQNSTGGVVRIGIIGICTNVNKQPYVVYEDYYSSAKRIYNVIKDSIDCFIVITHLEVEDDRELAKQMPEISLIMGGHEHQNNLEHVNGVEIAKADANVRTVYVHKLKFDANNKLVDLNSELITIDSSIAEDPETKELVDMWVDRAFKGFREKGFEPNEVVTVLKEPLDGRDETIRELPTNMGKAIAGAMLKACPGCDLAFFNGGSVRIDDELRGEVTQYDIIRTLPYGGKILEVDMKGSLLIKMLETGLKNKGSGGYLQYINVNYDTTANAWMIEGKSISSDNVYKAAVAEFLLTGLEQNMSFFTKDNSDIVKIITPDNSDAKDPRNDVRVALINYLKDMKE